MSRLHPTQQRNDFMDFVSIMKTNNKQGGKFRTEPARHSRDKSTSRNNNNINQNNQLIVPRSPVTKTSQLEEIRNKTSAQELVHKEVFNNNMATVEVTVRTVATKGSEEDKREPWSKLLMSRKSEDNIPGTFGHFDPLRTLHFLSKELQMKLQSVCPSDSNVQQIINDMQNAIHRLPPDVLSQLKTTNPDLHSATSAGDTILKKVSGSSIQNNKEKNRETQTVIIGDTDTKKMQKQLEESASKLEANCKEMEDLCNKFRQEKDELEAMLSTERETVISLQKELKDCIIDKELCMNQEIKKLETERDSLLLQVKNLQEQLDTQSITSQTTEDLRAIIETLKNKQIATDHENNSLRNELTLMKLEKDKKNVLLECRDKQLNELRAELESMQQLISNQLMDMKNNKVPFSTCSSFSSVSQFWNFPSKTQKVNKSIHELFLNNGVMRKIVSNKDLDRIESSAATLEANEKSQDVQVIPQKEKPEIPSNMTSQMTFSEFSLDNFNNKSSHQSIKNLFAEIKQQAFKKYNITSLNPDPSDTATDTKCKTSKTHSFASRSQADSRESESS